MLQRLVGIVNHKGKDTHFYNIMQEEKLCILFIPLKILNRENKMLTTQMNLKNIIKIIFSKKKTLLIYQPIFLEFLKIHFSLMEKLK